MEKKWTKLDDQGAAAAIRNLTEMMHMKGQLAIGGHRQCSEVAVIPSSSSSLDAVAHIRGGSFYEIDRSKLPIKIPDQLKLVRVIMVSKKSKCSVSLRYPSMFSLRAHFSGRNRRKQDARMLPSLDEQYAMGSELAGDVLYRRIPPHEVAVHRNRWSFWVVVSNFKEQEILGKSSISTLVPSPSPIASPAFITGHVNVVCKKGLCWYELNSTGMVQWGRRRHVRFLGPHEEQNEERNLSKSFPGKGEEEERGIEDNEEDDKGEEEVTMSVSDNDYENTETDRKISSKRKLQGAASYKIQTSKKLKHENLEIVLDKPNKRREAKNSIERWSVQRYNLAEKNMLKIMKDKGAVFGKPMLRPELRAEARKLIGDTGLLDHLLKHMAGKVAPGGEERFMRRHNSDGAMEYWLERADLMETRKKAGVQDPYWTPPPGWKLGDNPTQDPVCARELKELREEISKLKKSMLETKKSTEDLADLVITPNSSVATQNLVQDASMLLPLKEKYVNLMNMKSKLEGQLLEIAQSLHGMEEEMGKLKCMVEDPQVGSTTPPLGTEIRETKEQEKSNKTVLVISDEEEKDSNANAQGKGKTPAFPRKRRNTCTVAKTEDKAAKIQRLKSGFRICKPQGTFLWPNMSSSRQVIPIDDLFAIPTPPSVDSSIVTASRQEHRPQPITSTAKPSAERSSIVAVNFSPTPVSKHPPQPLPLEATNAQYANNNTTSNSNRSSTTTKTTLINLNEVPGNPHHHDHEFYGSDSQSNISPCPLTYQRRHHHNHMATSSSSPRTISAKKENEMSQWDGGNHQQHQMGYMSAGPRTLLALSTPSSSNSMDNNSRRV